MNDVLTGPEPGSEQPIQRSVDAQSETQRDLDRGLGGVEANLGTLACFNGWRFQQGVNRSVGYANFKSCRRRC